MQQVMCMYRITAPSGLQYIGVTKDLNSRIKAHLRVKYKNTMVGPSLRKHGIAAHKIEKLLVGERDFIFEMEKRMIEVSGTLYPGGMNLVAGGMGGSNAKQTESANAKRRMYRPSLETKAAIGEATRKRYALVAKPKVVATGRGAGKKKSPEHAAKLRAHLARVRPSDTLAKFHERIKNEG